MTVSIQHCFEQNDTAAIACFDCTVAAAAAAAKAETSFSCSRIASHLDSVCMRIDVKVGVCVCVYHPFYHPSKTKQKLLLPHTMNNIQVEPKQSPFVQKRRR